MNDRLDQLRTLLADEPHDTFLRYAVALELKRLGRTEEAIADLQMLVRDEPGHVASYYQLALLLGEMGRNTEAIEVCKAGSLQCIVTGDRKARAELFALQVTLEDDPI